MSPTDDRDPTRDRLADLLDDAVDPIEPADRLAEIRQALHARPHPKETTMSHRRTWGYALLGAVSTAAVIGAIAFASGVGDSPEEPGPASPSSPSSSAAEPEPDEAEDTATESPGETQSPSPSETSSPGAPETALGIYYVGDTERAGPRLYREFRRGPGSPDGALDLLQAAPSDPDYRTLWPEGSLESATTEGDTVVVSLGDASLRDRPDGMSEAEADAAVEQVIWTMQAAVQDRAPVQFRLDGNPIDQVYGVPTAEPLAEGPVLEVLSHLNITTPEQGATIGGDTIRLEGRGNSFEANVGWELRRGDEVVKQGFATMDGWMEEKLFPFSTTIEVGDLPPGDYTVFATTDDPTGGTEGIGAMTDTKDVTIQ
jgi:hypothetical protein